MSTIKAQPLSGAALDVLWCLFAHGPTYDGDVPSKMGRDELVDMGLAERYDGWQWLTRHGAETAIDAGYDSRKEKWSRERRA